MKHALAFSQGQTITPKELPQRVAEFKPTECPTVAIPSSGMSQSASLKSFLKQKEKEYIGQILNATGGDKEKAAEALKVNLSTLYRKLGG